MNRLQVDLRTYLGEDYDLLHVRQDDFGPVVSSLSRITCSKYLCVGWYFMSSDFSINNGGMWKSKWGRAASS